MDNLNKTIFLLFDLKQKCFFYHAYLFVSFSTHGLQRYGGQGASIEAFLKTALSR